MFLLVHDTNAISLHKLLKKEVLCFCLYSTQMPSHYRVAGLIDPMPKRDPVQ